jgi:hypothetical protein
MLSADTLAFVQGSVSIIAASSDAQCRATLVRALGCRMDGEQITVFLAASQSAALLDDVREHRRIAVVFSRPLTHQTVQLKGADASILHCAKGDLAIVGRYRASMVGEIGALGFPCEFTAAMLAADDDDLVAVRFSIAEAFSQTPGPDAGQPLAAGA